MTYAKLYANNARILKLSLYSTLLDHYLDCNMVEAFYETSAKMRAIISEIESV